MKHKNYVESDADQKNQPNSQINRIQLSSQNKINSGGNVKETTHSVKQCIINTNLMCQQERKVHLIKFQHLSYIKHT